MKEREVWRDGEREGGRGRKARRTKVTNEKQTKRKRHEYSSCRGGVPWFLEGHHDTMQTAAAAHLAGNSRKANTSSRAQHISRTRVPNLTPTPRGKHHLPSLKPATISAVSAVSAATPAIGATVHCISRFRPRHRQRKRVRRQQAFQLTGRG